MERLVLIGVSQRRGGTQALEDWTARVQAISDWPDEVTEAVAILTCNRCDLVLALKEGTDLGKIRKWLSPKVVSGYAFADEAALEQLCRVATSLDSLNPGEDQIMNQVRLAFEKAKSLGRVGPVTGFAFQTALRIAKRVRQEIPMAPAHTSLFSLAKPEFERLLPSPAVVAILGIGQMGSLVARHLSTKEGIRLILVNRSPEKARALALELGLEYMDFAGFFASPPQLHGLVTATSVEDLITEKFLKSQKDLRVIADLGIPRNVVPKIPKQSVLIDLEKMQDLGEMRRKYIQSCIAQAELLIQEELELALGEWAERQLGQAIVQLRLYYHQTLEHIVGKRLESAELNRLANRLAHIPIKGLRGLAKQHGLHVAESFLREAGLEWEQKDTHV